MKIEINVLTQSTGEKFSIELSDSITGNSFIKELITNNIIPGYIENCKLTLGNIEIDLNKSLQENGVKNHDTIMVILKCFADGDKKTSIEKTDIKEKNHPSVKINMGKRPNFSGTINIGYSNNLTISKKNKETEQNIDEIAEQLRTGYLKTKIPSSMKVGLKYRVNSLISYDLKQLKEEFINGESNTDKVELTKVMKLTLQGDDNFEIDVKSEPEQLILENTASIWEWVVTPKNRGKHKLSLKLVAKFNVEKYGLTSHERTVYEKVILVKVNFKYSISSFLGENWQWLLSTIIGSGVLWQIIKNWTVITEFFK